MVPRFGLNTYSETFSEISAVSIEKGKILPTLFSVEKSRFVEPIRTGAGKN